MKWTKSSAVLVAVWACMGCAEDVDSEAIRTQGMYAKFEAVADGGGTTDVTCSLRVGGDDPGATYVRLTGDDVLTAITDMENKELNHKGSGDKHFYEATLDGDAHNMEIQIAFTRGDADENAEDSVVLLPAPFTPELDGLDAEAEIARGTDVKIVWENDRTGDMTWSADGDCIFPSSGSGDDDGSLTIGASDIDVKGTSEGESCTVTVTMDRTSQGTIDPAFEEGGKFSATQRRTVTFVSTPGPDETGGMGGSNP